MKWGIKHQVLLLALVPTISLSLLLGIYFISTRLQDLEETLRSQGKAIASRFAHAGEYGVFSHNKHLLQKLAVSSLLEHETEGMAFYSPSGDEIATAGKFTTGFSVPSEEALKKADVIIKSAPHAMVFIVPITLLKENNDTHSRSSQTATLIGWLKLELETSSIHSRQMQILLNSGLIVLLGLSISGYYAFYIARSISNPISALAHAVEKIKKGEFDTRTQVSAYQEIAVLGSGINTMAQALKNAHQKLLDKVDQATLSLRRSLETIEVQNIELDISKRIAENANRVKSEFLADMSHEIRTPLGGVIGFVNLLKKTELNDKQKEYLATIQKTTHSLLTILNDILDFSKIEAGKLRFEYAPMDIRLCIQEVFELFATHVHEKNILLIPLIYEEIPGLILGDALRIKQIITNLVSNAIKFTEKGTVVVQVVLEYETLSHLTIRVSVIDTGVGLSVEEQKVLFKAFNQPKADPNQKFGGTGLGLVISKKLAEHMGGKIGVVSEPGKETTFWFTFQAGKYTGSPLAFPQRTSIEAQIQSNEMPSFTIHSKLPVLIVDDNLDNLKLLSILLEQLHIQTKTAESGEEALTLFRKEDFQLIFMDIRMPHMNGMEATQMMRAIETEQNRPRTPIIALTANVFPEEKKTLIAAGMDDYLRKPIDETALETMLHRWIVPTIQSSAQTTQTLKAIDWELAKKLAGNKLDLAIEFMEKLLATLPAEKETINQVFETLDWEKLRDVVHKLHGACCYCGVPELKQATQALEKATQSASKKTIQPYLEAFNQAVDTLMALPLDAPLN